MGGLDMGAIIGISIAGGILLLGGISKMVHGNGEEESKASYQGGKTRHHRNRGTRRHRKR